MKLQLLGWGPDLDPTTPGILLDATNVYPTTDGLRALPTNESIAIASGLTGHVRSMAMAKSGANVHTVLAVHTGTYTTAATLALSEVLADGSVTARGTCTAGTYTTPVVFRAFDAKMYAARSGSPLKNAAYNGDFTAVSGAPSCALIEATKDFLIAFDTADGYDWHCSAIGNGEDWSLSVSNQCVRGEFFDKSGPIVAAGRSSENLVCWTGTQMWIGRYAGPPEVWQWEQVSRDIGCVGPEAVAETPFGLCWVARKNVYVLRDNIPAPLNIEPIRRTVFEAIYQPHLQFTQLAWDRKRALLWMFCNTFTEQYQARRQAYVYHFESQRWGLSSAATFIKAASQLPVPEYAFGGTTYDDMPVIVADGTDTRLQRTNNAAGTASGVVASCLFGDPAVKTMVRAVRPVYSERAAATAVAYIGGAAMPGESVGYGGAITLDADDKFPTRRTGRWHSVQLSLVDNDVIAWLDVDAVPMGQR